jgi:hypothetical protein
MTPLPALVAQDDSLIAAPQISNKTEKYTANPLDKILTYTPIPTVILDSSLLVVEVYRWERRCLILYLLSGEAEVCGVSEHTHVPFRMPWGSTSLSHQLVSSLS